MVRIPAFQAGGPGSIPGRRTILRSGSQRSGAAEARWAHNPKVGGSKPPFATFYIQTPWGISSIGRVRALQARGTGIETRILHCFITMRIALVAQMVERKTLNLVVVGSIPTEGVFCFMNRAAV